MPCLKAIKTKRRMVNSDKKEELAPVGGERRAASSKESGGGLGQEGYKGPSVRRWPVVFPNRSEGWGLENRRTLGIGVQGRGKRRKWARPQSNPTF